MTVMEETGKEPRRAVTPRHVKLGSRETARRNPR
jgi:hypothetical protein